MEQYTFNGEKYYYKNGKWLTSSWETAPLAVVSKLNALLVNKDDFEAKPMEELLSIIDGARNADNIQLAAQALEAAIGKATILELRQLLPRLTSNYRKLGRSQTAIDLFTIYNDKYGKQIISPALFTSVAAAYCDVDDFATGRLYANKANALSGGEASPELISVYKRIKEAEK